MYKRKLTIDIIRNEFIERNYKLLSSEYIRGEKLKYICNKHNDICQWIRYDHFQQGHGCKFCGIEKSAESKRISFEFIKEKYNEVNFDLIDNEFINSHTPMKCICRNHPDIVQKIPYTNIQRGQKCLYCAREININKKRLNLDFIKQQFVESGRKPLFSEYHNSYEYLPYECMQHPGEIYYINYIGVKNNINCCPNSWKTAGENKIEKYLKNNNIKYIPQKRFKDCKDIFELKMDFYLVDYNIIVEYNGQQHYESFDFFGGIPRFISQQRKDKIKRDYCKASNIPLLEIPYWRFSKIAEILSRVLSLTSEELDEYIIEIRKHI